MITTSAKELQPWPGMLRVLVVHQPGAHPMWSNYLVGLAHLRGTPDLAEPQKHFPDATHEISVFALSPDSEPSEKYEELFAQVLEPPNLVFQFGVPHDEAALGVFARFEQHMGLKFTLDTDYRSSMKAVIAQEVAAINRELEDVN